MKKAIQRENICPSKKEMKKAIQRENICPSKKQMNKAVTMLKLNCPMFAARL
jgi:hypothetical protein